MKVTMRNISKSFGPVRVLEGIDFSVVGGEIHALALKTLSPEAWNASRQGAGG